MKKVGSGAFYDWWCLEDASGYVGKRSQQCLDRVHAVLASSCVYCSWQDIYRETEVTRMLYASHEFMQSNSRLTTAIQGRLEK